MSRINQEPKLMNGEFYCYYLKYKLRPLKQSSQSRENPWVCSLGKTGSKIVGVWGNHCSWSRGQIGDPLYTSNFMPFYCFIRKWQCNQQPTALASESLEPNLPVSNYVILSKPPFNFLTYKMRIMVWKRNEMNHLKYLNQREFNWLCGSGRSREAKQHH